MTNSISAPSARARVRRLPKRGHYDRATIDPILDAGLVAHVGYVIDGQPYVTPTAYWREGDHVYWHGSSASRMLSTLAGGVPVCLTVTHLDGFVLARSGFNHSMNYRAVMLFGIAEAITDPALKEAALDRFVERLFPNRNMELRSATAQEIKATSVLRMSIDEASAKVRTGDPGDDEADYALPVWAGVVPIRQVVGAPLPDARLHPGCALPSDLVVWQEGAHLDTILTATALPATIQPPSSR